jgi:hypothetical protein
VAAHTAGGVAHQATQANAGADATASAANATPPPTTPTAQTTTALPAATTVAGPVEQVTTALLSTATGAVSRIDPGSAGTVTQLQLRPESLGAVTVTIARATDGSARVDIAATRPETLMLLSRDQSVLNNALGATGLASPGAAVHLHLSLADVAAGSHAGFGGDGSGGAGQGRSETANQLASIAADAGGFGGSQGGGFAANGGGNGGAGQTGYAHASSATPDTPADTTRAQPVRAARGMGDAAVAIDITA